jgi:hypothetical protein
VSVDVTKLGGDAPIMARSFAEPVALAATETDDEEESQGPDASPSLAKSELSAS